MPRLVRIGLALACGLVAAVAGANDVPPNFPNPENVRIEADVLRWDAVPDAGGYNVYIDTDTGESAVPLTYLTTVKGATELELTSRGTYSVVSFNADASLFSNQFSPGVRVVFREGRDLGAPIQLTSITCANVAAGESCTASCPDVAGRVFAFRATGGACATADAGPVDATADEASYTCTVEAFSSEVRAQVYCLDAARFER